jgi:hypothetical protein
MAGSSSSSTATAGGRGGGKWQWDYILGKVATWFTYYLFWVQPGVDRQAVVRFVYEWVPDYPGAGLGRVTVILVSIIPTISCLTYALLYHFEWPLFEK